MEWIENENLESAVKPKEEKNKRLLVGLILYLPISDATNENNTMIIMQKENQSFEANTIKIIQFFFISKYKNENVNINWK